MTQIEPTINLDTDGLSSGYLKLPYSSDRSAYGWIPIPIVAAKNGDGPTVMMTGGVHGDEYEGQIIVAWLARNIDMDRLEVAS